MARIIDSRTLRSGHKSAHKSGHARKPVAAKKRGGKRK